MIKNDTYAKFSKLTNSLCFFVWMFINVCIIIHCTCGLVAETEAFQRMITCNAGIHARSSVDQRQQPQLYLEQRQQGHRSIVSSHQPMLFFLTKDVSLKAILKVKDEDDDTNIMVEIKEEVHLLIRQLYSRTLFGTLLFLFVSPLTIMSATDILHPEPAFASYSAYTRREQDWQERINKGEIQIKTAKDLKKELAIIAPMNSERSKIFCPNGPSSAVSPLMENKCGDRLAAPSVFGRTEDTVGNSIPGFSGGGGIYYSGSSVGSTSSLASELQNLEYGFTIPKVK